MSLDGIIESPEMWSLPYWNDEISRFKLDELFTSDAHLLGRVTYQGFVVTYQGFAAAWPSENDRQMFVDRMNSLPKYVVSTTLEKAEWSNSYLMKKNIAEEISKLKHQAGQNILVAGSGTLVQTLMQNELVDEYHLIVCPIVLGSGKHLFKDGSNAALKLADVTRFRSGAILLIYKKIT
jgi:dihydrofolate reductase